MRLLRWLGIVLLVLVGGVVALGVAARFSDGPLGILPGGPLAAGERVTEAEVDFAFAADLPTIELQLLDPPRSRTVWLVVHEGALYVPCGFLSVPLFKQWPYEAVEDGRAVLRIQGRLYDRQVVKVEDPEEFARTTALVAAKYGGGGVGPPDPDEVWVFRLDARPGA